MATRVIAVVLIAVYGCNGGRDSAASTRDAGAGRSASTAPADTTPSMDTLLRRFQAGLPRPDSLTGTSATREALTRRYLEAIARSDTTALRDMHITRAEYAHVYFPSSKMMKPPYELPPDVAWMLHTADSNKGIRTVLGRFGGQLLRFGDVRCPGEPLREGHNVVWRDCRVRYRAPNGIEAEQSLFAAIIERDGRFKFFSYAATL